MLDQRSPILAGYGDETPLCCTEYILDGCSVMLLSRWNVPLENLCLAKLANVNCEERQYLGFIVVFHGIIIIVFHWNCGFRNYS